MSGAALERFEGETPTREHVEKVGCEVIRLADIAPKMRGKAVRMGDGWRPKTLYNKGRITKRQYAAACELVTLYEAGFIAPIKGMKLQDRVQSSARPSAPQDGMLDAATRYRRAMAGLCYVQRVLLQSIVIRGDTIEAASKHAAMSVPWLPKSQQNKEVAASALFAAGLEAVADALRL